MQRAHPVQRNMKLYSKHEGLQCSVRGTNLCTACKSSLEEVRA